MKKNYRESIVRVNEFGGDTLYQSFRVPLLEDAKKSFLHTLLVSVNFIYLTFWHFCRFLCINNKILDFSFYRIIENIQLKLYKNVRFYDKKIIKIIEF